MREILSFLINRTPIEVVPCLIVFLLLIGAQKAEAQSPTPQSRESQPAPKIMPRISEPSASGRSREGSEEDVVRINTALVAVPVSVADRNGKSILDLRRENFEVYEDGTRQEIATFEPTEKPFTIALLLDISDSMRFRIGDIQAAALAFVDQLRQEDRIMVAAFDSQLKILSEPTTNHDLVRDAIRRTSMGGGTRIYDAVNLVLNQRFNQVRGRKALIIFSDGIDTGSFQSDLKHNERDAEESDVLIYPIQYSTSKDLNDQLRAELNSPNGIMLPKGNGASSVQISRAQSYLRSLSQKTGARLYRVDDAQDLTKSFIQIAAELRQQYTLSYYPKVSGERGQRRQIKVRVNGPGLTVRARSSYIR